MLSTVKVLVVDDYAPWVHFVSLALAIKPEVQIVGVASDGLTAVQKVAELKPDVVILDIGLPDINGIQVAKQILALAPKIRILFLTENTAPDIVRAALLTGAQGFVVKSFAAKDLVPALEAILLDCHFVSAAATPNLLEAPIFGKRCTDT
ncbi:MAG TPA: response regulator transcription factor [Candidatus Angelobacter sp.]